MGIEPGQQINNLAVDVSAAHDGVEPKDNTPLR